jgi:hypothetical protein
MASLRKWAKHLSWHLKISIGNITMTNSKIRTSLIAGLISAGTLLTMTSGANAAPNIFIDWTSLTLPTPTTNSLTSAGTGVSGFTAGDVVTMNGTTSGDYALPFSVTLSFTGTALSGTQYFGSYYGPGATGDFFQVARGTQGGMADSLYLIMGNGAGVGYPKFRSASQQVQLDFNIDTTGFPYAIDSSEFTLLDVDNGDTSATPSWRDEVEFLTSGGVFTAVTPSSYNITGNPPTFTQSLGVGNTAFSSNASNITGQYTPGITNLSFFYRPGAGDALTAGNQLIGLNGAGFTSAQAAAAVGGGGVAAPEPGTLVLGIFGIVSGAIARRRKQK